MKNSNQNFETQKEQKDQEITLETLCSDFPELVKLFIAPKLDTKEFGSMLLVPCWRKIYPQEEIEKVKENYFWESDQVKGDATRHSTHILHNGKKVSHGVWTSKNSLGKTLFRRTFSFGREVGKHIWFYPSGRLERVKNYIDGRENYDETHYFTNGSLSRKKRYRKGLLEGLFMDWSIDGKIERVEKYHKGKLEGSSKLWYYSGVPEKFTWHHDGKKVGLQLWFSKDRQKVDKLFH